MFGDSVLANAVHGSSTFEKAQEVIKTFIGDVPEDGETAEGEGETGEGGEGGEQQEDAG